MQTSVPDEVIELLNAQSAISCPCCGGKLGSLNLYCGGRGYVTFDTCTECEFMQKAGN